MTNAYTKYCEIYWHSLSDHLQCMKYEESWLCQVFAANLSIRYKHGRSRAKPHPSLMAQPPVSVLMEDSLPNELQDDVVSVVLEFLEACIHQILHSRALYQPELFERRRLYDTVVRSARHPGLVKYIHTVTESMRVSQLQTPQEMLADCHSALHCESDLQSALLKNELDKVVVALLNDKHIVVEQFVFDMPVRFSPALQCCNVEPACTVISESAAVVVCVIADGIESDVD